MTNCSTNWVGILVTLKRFEPNHSFICKITYFQVHEECVSTPQHLTVQEQLKNKNVYNSNAHPNLSFWMLAGNQTWHEKDLGAPQGFLRRPGVIFWPNKIKALELYRRTKARTSSLKQGDCNSWEICFKWRKNPSQMLGWWTNECVNEWMCKWQHGGPLDYSVIIYYNPSF